jgi:hypothetical protein
MNYSELLDNVRSYTEVDSNVLSNSIINVFITNVENKIDRAIDSDAQRRYATTNLTVNNSFVEVGSLGLGGFRFARGVQIVQDTGERVWVEQVDTTFIDEYAVERSSTDSNYTGLPKYWANWDNNYLVVAPTPDQAYTLELWYNEQPERIGNGSGSTSTTTFISNNAPEVLLYGTVAEAYSFLKNPQDMQLYEAKFTSALKLFADEQMGRKRRDEFTDGVLRIPLKSMDPDGGN